MKTPTFLKLKGRSQPIAIMVQFGHYLTAEHRTPQVVSNSLALCPFAAQPVTVVAVLQVDGWARACDLLASGVIAEGQDTAGLNHIAGVIVAPPIDLVVCVGGTPLRIRSTPTFAVGHVPPLIVLIIMRVGTVVK